MEVAAGKIYQHKARGNTYKVLCRANMECDGSFVVVYQHFDVLTNQLSEYIWVRPLSEFKEKFIEYEP
jgi:hypothetical protein